MESRPQVMVTGPRADRDAVEAALRAAGFAVAAEAAVEVRLADALRHGRLEIDLTAHQVCWGGQEVALTTREFELLVFLVRHPWRAFSRGELLEAVWGSRYRDEATVTEHVRRVRTKLGEGSRMITTLRGTGYRFDPEPSGG